MLSIKDKLKQFTCEHHYILIKQQTPFYALNGYEAFVFCDKCGKVRELSFFDWESDTE